MLAWHRAWSNSVGGGRRVARVQREPRRALVDIATDQGDYQVRCDWLVACGGVRSFVRQALQLPFDGRTFNDRFLIDDVRMPAGLPAERRFWFFPSFHEGQSVLIHKQADDVWRVDFQLGPAPDPAQDREPNGWPPGCAGCSATISLSNWNGAAAMIARLSRAPICPGFRAG
ncbi:FAD-dependent monooxygenase [Chromobacterium violaceum]|uniref:FAD-dependent monooxygenase n=1 Tax=Chromobacterium violaceum TaxID=536 RepID=UPI001BE8E74D|nr:FAD-dependent monooxygenase [Chromobacterium violaceum]MBT2866868.1 FAD-dependent monooxygenase [Chromobacterium violaceum]